MEVEYDKDLPKKFEQIEKDQFQDCYYTEINWIPCEAMLQSLQNNGRAFMLDGRHCQCFLDFIGKEHTLARFFQGFMRRRDVVQFLSDCAEKVKTGHDEKQKDG